MFAQSLILLALQCQTSALEWSAPPRRDVGRIQATIGDDETRVFPRRELTGVPADSFLAGPGRPIAGFDLAQAPGASVPFAPPTENMPPAAITPLPPDYRNEIPGAQRPPAVAVPAPTPPTAVPVVPPTPAAPAIPAAPLHAAAPVVQPIPVFFQTPTTGSTFIPAGAAAPIVAPGGAVLAPAPMVAAPVGTGLQLAPTAGPAPGLATVQQGTGFLSESGATLERFQLRPRMPAEAASPPPSPPAAGRAAPPTVPEPTIPMPAPPTAPAPPPVRTPPATPPQDRPLERLEIPEAPPAADPLPNLDGPSPLPAIP